MSRSCKKNQYRKSRRFDRTCRCHGSCEYCLNNRLHQDKRDRTAADEELKQYIGMRRKITVNGSE